MVIVAVAKGVSHLRIIMGGPLAYGGGSMLVRHLWVTRWKGGSGAGTPAGTRAGFPRLLEHGSNGCGNPSSARKFKI